MTTALRTFQRQLEVTGNNIANVDTPGFSRRTVDLVENEPTLFQQGGMQSLGNGVNIASLNRIRDMFLEGRRVGAGSDQGRYEAHDLGMKRIETLFPEPGPNGIATAIDRFFNAWSGLSSNPSDTGARTEVQLAGRQLTDRVRGTYSSLVALENQQNQAIAETVSGIQKDMDEIAFLNQEIRNRQTTGAEPNELLDRRDVAVRSLSSKIGITVNQFPDGSYVIASNGRPLVEATGARQLPTTFDASTYALTDPTMPVSVRSGSLAGLMDNLNRIQAYKSQLDTLANSLRTEVNTVHGSGTNSYGATGLRFFKDVPVTLPATPQTGAIDFALDTAGVTGPPSSPGVGSDARAIASGSTGTAGDGGVARSLSQLRESPITALGNVSFSRYYQDFVGQMGRDASYADSSLQTQTAVITQIDNQIQSVSGVSIDDEMANLMRFQRSYQAAARALSMMDQVMEELLNMVAR